MHRDSSKEVEKSIQAAAFMDVDSQWLLRASPEATETVAAGHMSMKTDSCASHTRSIPDLSQVGVEVHILL